MTTLGFSEGTSILLLPLRLFPNRALLRCKVPDNPHQHSIIHHAKIVGHKQGFDTYLSFLHNKTEEG